MGDSKLKKVLEDLKTLRTLQNIICGYLAILGLLMLLTWVSPVKEFIGGLTLIVFWAMFLAIPFALFVMIYSLQVLKAMVVVEPRLKNKARLAGWSSLVAGIYILGSFIFYGQISLWTFLISHDLEVAFQSSPVIMGLLLLATHVHVARSSLARLKAAAQ